MHAQMTDDPATRRKKIYSRGPTAVFALKSDPRLSYALYVPPGFDDAPDAHDLIVSVHGTTRAFWTYRDGFTSLARYHRCVVLAPLFPVGVMGDDNEDGYKLLKEGNIRYDLALLDMVAEAGARLGSSFGKFMLFGFSGGGQFTNRFLMLHPQRLLAASIGAGGSVTLIDDTRDFWVGTRDIEARFGIALDIPAMRKVAVQMIVGAADIETWEINYKPGSHNYMEGINDTGHTRIKRNTALKQNFEAHGIKVQQDIVPNVPHDSTKLYSRVEDFFQSVLQRHRAEQQG